MRRAVSALTSRACLRRSTVARMSTGSSSGSGGSLSSSYSVDASSSSSASSSSNASSIMPPASSSAAAGGSSCGSGGGASSSASPLSSGGGASSSSSSSGGVTSVYSTSGSTSAATALNRSRAFVARWISFVGRVHTMVTLAPCSVASTQWRAPHTSMRSMSRRLTVAESFVSPSGLTNVTVPFCVRQNPHVCCPFCRLRRALARSSSFFAVAASIAPRSLPSAAAAPSPSSLSPPKPANEPAGAGPVLVAAAAVPASSSSSFCRTSRSSAMCASTSGRSVAPCGHRTTRRSAATATKRGFRSLIAYRRWCIDAAGPVVAACFPRRIACLRAGSSDMIGFSSASIAAWSSQCLSITT
mmetsp:Transcript_2712/g.8441  ORF Transcript_2712/g.8441 Transcript_2712/m.8441 type:complete len:357 (-) Transcript_2712:59-1129(-)